MPVVRVLDESVNPTGTAKDRKSAYVVARAKQTGVRHLCIITAGNGGNSLAHFAHQEGMRVTCIVRPGLKPSILERLEATADRVIKTSLNRLLSDEEILALAREADEQVWNVTDGFSDAYQDILDDIDAGSLDYLACPISTGEMFIGLYEGIVARGLATKLIGARAASFDSVADKLAGRWTPNQDQLDRIVSEGHLVLTLDEDALVAAYEKHKNEYRTEPSATASWAAVCQAGLPPEARVGIVSTGKGLE